MEFLAKRNSFYAERVDDIVTVYHSQETDDVVGFSMNGDLSFCGQFSETIPGLGIEIRDGRD